MQIIPVNSGAATVGKVTSITTGSWFTVTTITSANSFFFIQNVSPVDINIQFSGNSYANGTFILKANGGTIQFSVGDFLPTGLVTVNAVSGSSQGAITYMVA